MQLVPLAREDSAAPAADAAPSFAPAPGPGAGRAFAALMWRRRTVALLVLVLVALVVPAVLAFSPRTYTALARVAATPPQSLTQSPANFDDMLGTLADVAQSRPLLEQVDKAVPQRSLTQLQKEVRGNVVFGTVLIQITVADADPRLAAQIANAVAGLLPSVDPSRGYFDLTTTQPATVPETHSSPDTKIVVLAGALLAIALAIGAAVVYDRTARTVDSVDEVQATARDAVLGVIPRPEDPAGVPATDPGSREFQALRALRVALEFASSRRPTRALVVAPVVADPAPGWLEVNLAVALAEVGHRVLLIDADHTARRRHPVLDTAGQPGLYDLLAGTTDLRAASISGPVDDVTVVPLGNVDLAAPSLLEMRFRGLLAEIDSRYDVLLIHAAPLSESDDARIMAIDGGLLATVPVGRVRPRVLESAMAALHEVRIRVLGTVVLGARTGAGRRGR